MTTVMRANAQRRAIAAAVSSSSPSIGLMRVPMTSSGTAASPRHAPAWGRARTRPPTPSAIGTPKPISGETR